MSKNPFKKLTRTDLKNIIGGDGTDPITGPNPGAPHGCGCDCAGRVTGPKYCHGMWMCPQVYTCDGPPPRVR